MDHTPMENRNGFVVGACLTQVDAHAERIVALAMIELRTSPPHAITLGAETAYDTRDFLNELRVMNTAPYVEQNPRGRSSVIDDRTMRHTGYAVRLRIPKGIEEAFRWIKTIPGQETGQHRVGWAFVFPVLTYNLTRLPKPMAAPA